MSRLDSFIFRMTAQREILNHIGGRVKGWMGRSSSSVLATAAPSIICVNAFRIEGSSSFDRAVGAHKTSTPEPENMVVGEIRETAKIIGINAALAHVDIGTGYDEKDAITLTWLPQLMAGACARTAIAVSGLELRASAA